MQSLCDNGRRKHPDIRLVFWGQIHAADKSSVSGDGVLGWFSVLFLEQPLPTVRSSRLDLDIRNMVGFVKDEDVIADRRAPLESHHVSALSQLGRYQKLAG